jgi:drug/metabolite transporter (DMT)-like permease
MSSRSGMDKRHRTSASVALVVASLGWALAPVFIRFLADAYDPYSQAFIRYAAATLGLIVVCTIQYRDEFLGLLRNSSSLVAAAAVITVQQYTWTAGCYGTTATVAQLVSKLSIVFVIVFSFFLFHEERAVIRSPYYIAGTLLSFVGVGAVLVSDPVSLIPTVNRPIVLLLITALLWAVYVVWGKHLVIHAHPLPVFTVLSLYATLGLGALTALLGKPHTLVSAGPRYTLIAIISGLIPIATAHPCFHYAQKHLGAAFSNSILLFNPLATYAIALLFWSDERLAPTQWAGAIVLLTGTLLVTLASRENRSSA